MLHSNVKANKKVNKEIDFFWISSCTKFSILENKDGSYNVYIRNENGVEKKEGFSNWNEAYTFLKKTLRVQERLHHQSIKDFPIYFDEAVRKKFIEKLGIKEYHFDVSTTNKPTDEFTVYASTKKEAFVRFWKQLDDHDCENVTKIDITYVGPIL